jgi:hypothetical protein
VLMQRATCRRCGVVVRRAWQGPHSREGPPSGPLATACRDRDALKASMEEALWRVSGMEMTLRWKVMVRRVPRWPNVQPVRDEERR